MINVLQQENNDYVKVYKKSKVRVPLEKRLKNNKKEWLKLSLVTQ